MERGNWHGTSNLPCTYKETRVGQPQSGCPSLKPSPQDRPDSLFTENYSQTRKLTPFDRNLHLFDLSFYRKSFILSKCLHASIYLHTLSLQPYAKNANPTTIDFYQ